MNFAKPIFTSAFALCFVLSTTTTCFADFLVDFEDVGSSLANEEFYNGSDGAGGFNSGPTSGLFFNNTFGSSGGFDFWDGWSYSNTTDTTTAGFGNQYSSSTGAGDGGSTTYGIAFTDSASITAGVNHQIESLSITNTTYAALSMRDGDAFAKKFGGTSGDDQDFLKIDIDGFDSAGNATGSLEFFLADYRFSDNSLDYIVDQWTTVDVSSLGAQRLGFRFASSDVGQFGINTPTYFAADNLNVIFSVPEPSSTLLFSGLGCLLLTRRKRK